MQSLSLEGSKILEGKYIHHTWGHQYQEGNIFLLDSQYIHLHPLLLIYCRTCHVDKVLPYSHQCLLDSNALWGKSNYLLEYQQFLQGSNILEDNLYNLQQLLGL